MLPIKFYEVYVCIFTFGWHALASTILIRLNSNLSPIHWAISPLGPKNWQFWVTKCINIERINRSCLISLDISFSYRNTFSVQISDRSDFWFWRWAPKTASYNINFKIFWNAEWILSDSAQTWHMNMFHGRECPAKFWDRYNK